jgi:hypothetical protein
MKFTGNAIVLSVFFLAMLSTSSTLVIAQDAANPLRVKFEQDLKAAVMSQSITVPQLKEIQDNVAVLKEAKGEEKPGAPVDLVTPYTAVSRIKAIMATVKEPARTTLRQDFQLMMAAKQPPPSTEPDTPGKKLGKDIFTAVMHGEPTTAQVQQLQESLNSLQSIKTSGGGMLQQFRELKTAKAQIEQTMTVGSFRPQDKQTVLDDLNNLGPKMGGGGAR